MAIRTTGQLGPGMNEHVPENGAWYDPTGIASPRLLNVEFDSDGRKRIWVKAGADIASAATAVTINTTTGVATAGAGGFETTVAGIKNGDHFWAQAQAL